MSTILDALRKAKQDQENKENQTFGKENIYDLYNKSRDSKPPSGHRRLEILVIFLLLVLVMTIIIGGAMAYYFYAKIITIDSKEEMKAVIHKLHADDIEMDYLLHKGKPEKAIVEVADKLGSDLIVICTDGRDNVMDFVTGTITEHVINAATCPVLVIRYKS